MTIHHTHTKTPAFHNRVTILAALCMSVVILLPADSLMAQATISLVRPPALSATACNMEIRDRLAQQQRLLRQVLFGVTEASTMPVNSTRYSKDGTPWLKVKRGTWRTAAAAFESTTWSDAQVNRETEWPGMNEMDSGAKPATLTGIFGQKQVFTSSLIPELAQSLRAFHCRLAMVCQGVRDTFGHETADASGLLTVTTAGCDDLVMEPLDQCRFGNAIEDDGVTGENLIGGIDASVVETECHTLAEQLAAREKAFMDIAIAYDAAQRTVMQLGGSMDLFLQGLRGDFLAPVEQTLPLLSALSRFSCVTPFCNK